MMTVVGLQTGQNADLAKLAIQHFQQDITVERFPDSAGIWSDDDGRYYKYTPELLDIKAVVEPVAALPDRDLRQLSEAERIEAQIVIWTETDLYTSDSQGSDSHQGFSDVVLYQGERFKVMKLQRRMKGAKFVRAICGLYEDRRGELHASSGEVM